MEKYSKEYYLQQFQVLETEVLLQRFTSIDLAPFAKEAMVTIFEQRGIDDKDIVECRLRSQQSKAPNKYTVEYYVARFEALETPDLLNKYSAGNLNREARQAIFWLLKQRGFSDESLWAQRQVCGVCKEPLLLGDSICCRCDKEENGYSSQMLEAQTVPVGCLKSAVAIPMSLIGMVLLLLFAMAGGGGMLGMLIIVFLLAACTVAVAKKPGDLTFAIIIVLLLLWLLYSFLGGAMRVA